MPGLVSRSSHSSTICIRGAALFLSGDSELSAPRLRLVAASFECAFVRRRKYAVDILRICSVHAGFSSASWCQQSQPQPSSLVCWTTLGVVE